MPVIETRVCTQCGKEKPLQSFTNGKKSNGDQYYARLCHGCRTYNYNHRIVNRDIYYARCHSCDKLDYCNTAVYLGKRLPCQPKRVEDIPNVREHGDLVKSWV